MDIQKLVIRLGSDLLPIIEVARLTLDSWPMRMSIELKSKMPEERLERLGERLRLALKEENPLGDQYLEDNGEEHGTPALEALD